MRTWSCKNFATFVASVALAGLLSSCEHFRLERPQRGAGKLAEHKYTPVVAAGPGDGRIAVTYATGADQKYKTEWRLSGYEFQSPWKRVSASQHEAGEALRAQTYVIEFRRQPRGAAPGAPQKRTVQVIEEQKLVVRVTYADIAP